MISPNVNMGLSNHHFTSKYILPNFIFGGYNVRWKFAYLCSIVTAVDHKTSLLRSEDIIPLLCSNICDAPSFVVSVVVMNTDFPLLHRLLKFICRKPIRIPCTSTFSPLF